VDGKEKHRFHGWERGIKDRLKGKELHGGAGDRGKIFQKENILPDCNPDQFSRILASIRGICVLSLEKLIYGQEAANCFPLKFLA
jgi:hypothetical protein